MPKVLISPLKAVSMLNQVNLMRKLLAEKGFDSEIKSTITLRDVRDPDTHAILWASLAIHSFLGGVTYVYVSCSKPKAVYATVEGYPTHATTGFSPYKRLDFIAVSQFVADCLRRVKLKVMDWCHHAIDPQQCERAIRASKAIRAKWDEEYPNRCKFIYVGRHDPRKALHNLRIAVSMLNKSHADRYVLFILSDPSAAQEFYQPNVKFLGAFGSLQYEQVLTLIAAADFLVFPSVSEGFGLPVLEANAVGVPALHNWMPPLSEFSSQEFNFVWDYDERELISYKGGQFWLFHSYHPAKLAGTMEMAIDCWENDRKQYLEYCEQAREHASKWDYRRVYPKLLKYLGVD